MIKFFRHIRKSLLMENKTGKYFKYAIGEIILVMVGILLALQVNNWNEKRLQNNLEVSYLKSLMEEFQGNLKEVRRVKTLNAKNMVSALELSNHIGPDTPTISEIELSKLILRTVFAEIQYRPGTGILNEIISSGKLSIISNQELKKALASLDGLMLKVRFQENEEHGQVRRDLITFLNSNNVDFRKMVFESYGENYGVKNSKFLDSNLHLLQSKQFNNYIAEFIYTAGFLQDNYYTHLEEQIENIINVIDSQIN